MGDRRKGFDVVYDAWRALCRRPWWDAQLVVVGAGAELASWRARAERDGLSPRIQFLGFRRDVPRILAASDALVSPARYEAYGLGVHEALCSALPALVSSEAGVAERYPASLASLLLDDPESAEALVEALIRWRDRIAAFQTLMLPFCEQLRARSWDDMARAIVSLCEERA
jgi:glycosyltransferase involved in cell wall biosynthesis